ncbi:MAG: ribosomal protein S18-alanine N-acetyltransferase [Burkholderiales bacterium]|nr:ribosomal protein S18-alanine N-acetyltransferase [Burkholderiales bacterium]
MQIRLANISDIPSLVQLDQESNLTPWSREDYLNSLNNLRQVISILTNHGKIVACVVYSKVLDEAEILQFWVKKVNKRQGLGEYLLKYLLHELHKKCVVKVFLEVREGNDAAINLYTKLGFNKVGQRKNYYRVDNWQFDAVIMLKALD